MTLSDLTLGPVGGQERAGTGWGIVGCGWVTRDHMAPALARAAAEANPVARPVAVYDPDPDAARRVADLLPGARLCQSLSELLGTDGLQAVYVATPNHRHREVAVAVAAAGIPLLIEKPLAADLDDAQSIVDACDGLIAGSAFDQRWHPAHAKISDLVENGLLGTVTAIRITYGCWLPPDWTPEPGAPHDNWRIDPDRAGGGALLDLAPHGIDLVGVLLGADDVAELTASTVTRVHDYAVDDGAVLAGRTRRGVLLSQHVSYALPDALPRRILEVVGTLGQVAATDTMGQTAGGRLTFTDATTGASEPVEFDTTTSPFRAQLERFSRAATTESPWGYSLARDLRLLRLLLTAAAT